MEILFWIVLAVGAGLTLTRLPGLGKSRNQAIFLCGTAMCVAFGLMVPPVYEAVESLFVRTNFTDLLAKLALFLAVNILIAQIAKPLGSSRALKLTSGLPGRMILVLAYAAEMVLFALTNTAESSPGLGAYINDPIVFAYNAVAVVYIAYLCSCVLGPLLSDVRKPGHPLRRWASSLLLAGFSLAIIRAGVLLVGFAVDGLYDLGQSISAVSALFVVSGLACAWVALRKYTRPGIKQSHLRLPS